MEFASVARPARRPGMHYVSHVRIPLHASVLIVLISLVFVSATLTSCRRSSTTDITAMGTLEVVEVDVAPTTAGRVVRVLVDEGSLVRAGDTLAILTQPTSHADIAGRTSSVAALRANLREVERGPRTPQIQQAQAELRAAEATATRATVDLERLRPLADQQIVSRQQLDAATAAAKIAAEHRDAARAALRLLEQGSTPEEIAAARAQVGTAKAALAATEAVAGDLILTAPVAGMVTSRNAEPGEVLAPAEPAITLGDVTQPWVRVYVDQQLLPFIHIGDSVHAILDGLPNHPFPGRVVAISPRAEYTPRVALTADERADLMFGVKVAFTDSTGMLKAGLPITVTFHRQATAASSRTPSGQRRDAEP
jgi:HlyD family secretion protein